MPFGRYYGRRRGEGIHTGKQAKVTVNYVDKVRFEVEPDFQRDTKFTQLWCVADFGDWVLNVATAVHFFLL